MASRRGKSAQGQQRRVLRAQPAHAPGDGFASPWVQIRSAGTHPFIYQKMIAAADRAAQAGDVVQVYERDGRLLGRGLYNPHSQIAVRMLAYGDVLIDDEFWRSCAGQAIELRRQLRIHEQTDCYRLVHAEGDRISGLIAERAADCLVMEIFSLGIYQRRDQIARALLAQASLAHEGSAEPPAQPLRVFTRVDDHIAALERIPRDASSRESVHVTIREHGIRYTVDITAGHKTGFFCDQRENRVRFARLCKDLRVLDLCCYTGGFGLCAKKLGGAAEVTAVDLDEKVIALARENANRNQVRISHAHSDAFIYLRQMIENGRQFDAVVLDPPKFARTRAEFEDALVRYNDLNMLAMQVVRPGGLLLTCSCSGLVSWADFTSVVHRASRRANRTLQVLDRTGAAPDHPVSLECPETAYLKAMWLRVL